MIRLEMKVNTLKPLLKLSKKVNKFKEVEGLFTEKLLSGLIVYRFKQIVHLQYIVISNEPEYVSKCVKACFSKYALPAVF